MIDFNQTHNGWIANIVLTKTGEDGIVFETPPIEGEKSSWQKLLDGVRSGEVTITGLRMQRHRLTFHSLPVKQCEGYFMAYEVRKKFFRSMGEQGEPEQLFQGVGSIVGDQVYIVWVNINPQSPPYIYTDVRSLEESKIHTTMS